MKSLKPHIISIRYSLLISGWFIITSLFIIDFQADKLIYYILFYISNTFITFLITTFFLNKFIQVRLKPIFRIIRDLPVEEAKKAKELSKRFDTSFDVDREVAKWATNKQEEIKRLKELERYRKEFVGNVSHELKTPIFNIQGYILTLIDGGMDDPKINKLYLERTVKSIDRMISIVEDLESINKLESGELKLKMESFNIIKLVEDVFEIEHMIARERKIALEFATRTDKPIHVYADKKRIMEVMSNLVVNGIKYGKKGGFVHVSFFDFDDHIVAEVRDNGIGIEKDQLHRIFERFYRVDKHRSREQGGTGLGLAIVKHIIEAHQQTINVKSQVDIGTTFNFTLAKAPK
jgi:two-component system, OmpR family, phosphate regulon sensor histidine kinase PhoR